MIVVCWSLLSCTYCINYMCPVQKLCNWFINTRVLFVINVLTYLFYRPVDRACTFIMYERTRRMTWYTMYIYDRVYEEKSINQTIVIIGPDDSTDDHFMRNGCDNRLLKSLGWAERNAYLMDKTEYCDRISSFDFYIFIRIPSLKRT